MFCAGHSQLADGRVLFTGGGGTNSLYAVSRATIFDPETRSWQSVPDMNEKRWYPTNTALPDGRVLTVSGYDGVNPLPVGSLELYDPRSNVWTHLVNAPLVKTPYTFMFLAGGGNVAFAGPTGSATQLQIDLAADPDSWFWFGTYPQNFSRGHSSAVMYGPGLVLKSGGTVKEAWTDPVTGVTTLNASVGQVESERIDLSATPPVWVAADDMNVRRRRHDLVALPDGTVLAVGGSQATPPVSPTNSNPDEDEYLAAATETEVWHPLQGWSLLAPLTDPRVYHSTAMLLPDGRVLSAGGESRAENRSAQIFSPPYLCQGLARPTITTAPEEVVYGDSMTVGTDDAQSIGAVNLVRLGAVTHGFDQDQRFLPLSWLALDATTLQVEAPANPSLAPPGLLHAVPDLGRWRSFLRALCANRLRSTESGDREEWPANRAPLPVHGYGNLAKRPTRWSAPT